MRINLSYDASVASAPAEFETAVAAAAQEIDGIITNDVTVTIQVGYGEDNGQSLPTNESTGGPSTSVLVSYADLKADLLANISSPADGIALANLPASDPTNGGNFVLYPAQEKALGLLPAGGSEIDGTVGFNSGAPYYNYDPNDRSNPSTRDFIGIAEHELTHALGRVSEMQFKQGYASLLDLFRYGAPGTLATAATTAPYFSIDGGATNLDTFDTARDWGDWAQSAGPDSFDQVGYFGVENPITAVDVTEMNVLGFSVATTPGTITGFTVSDEIALNTALVEVRFGATNTNYTISLAAGLPGGSLALDTALFAVNVPTGATLTIDGGGQTIDGGGLQGGFAVSSGNVVLQDLTIAHTLAQGGSGATGAGGGGGGAGEGGGLFIDSGATVTLNDVTFDGVVAAGGTGGAAENAYGGGNGGARNGGSAMLNGATSTAQTGGGPGADGQGGGGGGSSFLSPSTGPGGIGGWGGGGGGGGYAQSGTNAVGGMGGFGGGKGGDTTFIPGSYGYGGGGGGGGAGAGGDVFISNGGALVVGDGTISGGTVIAGAGGLGYDLFGNGPNGAYTGKAGTAGRALGTGIFIQGNGTEVLAPQAGHIVTIDGTIADQSGSGGTGANAGAGTLVAQNAGTVVLDVPDTYTGGTTLESGVVLELGGPGAAGSGAIDFAGPATLRIRSGISVANTITGFAPNDTIEVEGITATGSGYAGSVLTLTEASGAIILNLPGSFASDQFVVTNAAGNASVIVQAPRTMSWIGADGAAFGEAANWNDITESLSPALAAPTAIDTVEFNNPGGAVSGTGTVSGVDVGLTGAGVLQIGGGATLVTGSLDAGVVATDVGQIGLTGGATELLVTGDATVADDGTGVMSVLSGATFSAANLTIGSKGDASGAVVVSGAGSVINIAGNLNVGTALGTGDLTIGPGGVVNAKVVSLQGQVVLENGELDPTANLINQGQTAGGSGTISAGEIVDEGVIQAGGSKPSQKLLVVNGTVLGGGPWTINGTDQAQANGGAGVLQINAGGTLEMNGAVLNAGSTTFTDDVTPRSTYTVTNSVVDVNFTDAAGVLKLDQIAGFGGTVVAFQKGDSFVVTGGTLSGLGVSNNNTLTVSDSGHGGTDSLIFASPVRAGGFSIVNDNTIQVACFAAGTRINTETGPVVVEDLRVGDRLATIGGTGEAIIWIGQRTVTCERHPAPETVWPVRISAAAFGENVPVRDLYLSPDHAVFVNEVLVPVKLLINGTSIAQEKRSTVTYYHVELPRHEVIFAERLSVESYLALGDRANFHQADKTVLLFPDFKARLAPETARAWQTRGAAPLVMTGEELASAKAVVAAKATHGNPSLMRCASTSLRRSDPT